MTAQDLLNAPLDEAIAAMNGRVKANPSDAKPRIYLAELLCLAGNLERADLQLDTASKVDTTVAVWVAAFRNVLRAELSRREVFEQGRAPEFVGQPGPVLTAHLKALLALREGAGAEAADLLALAETARKAVAGQCNGSAFEDFRDLNDLTANFLEVLTGGGAYYWIPLDQIGSIEFLAPQRTRDLIWRRARVEVTDGPEGEVFIPTLYAGSHDATCANDIRIGRATDWVELEGGVVRGLGQRSFLVGEEDLSIMALEAIEFGVE